MIAEHNDELLGAWQDVYYHRPLLKSFLKKKWGKEVLFLCKGLQKNEMRGRESECVKITYIKEKKSQNSFVRQDVEYVSILLIDDGKSEKRIMIASHSEEKANS